MIALVCEARHETVVKHSRFIVCAGRVDDPAAAEAFLAARRDPQATHNCWAWRIGAAYRSSDDGEPGGTAGRPILAAIDGQGLDHVAVLVTRHFGGIKLGAGGLVRAYGGAAAECLRQADKVEVRPRVTLQLTVPFGLTGPVYTLVLAHGAERRAETYGADGLTIELRLDAAAVPAFAAALGDATRGRVALVEQPDPAAGR